MSSTPTDTLSPPDIRAGRWTFIATVVAMYVATFAFPQRPLTLSEIVGLVAAGGLYLLVGICGAEFYTHTASPLTLAAFYAIEIPLAGLIVYWTAGFFLAGLIMLPLAGLSVQVLPHRRMLAVCALLLVTLVASYGLRGGWEAALLAGIGYLAAIVFVVLVTQMAVREREARAEVERLATELAAANRRLREYAVQAEELAITRERARLAHEIHDTVGHSLTALDVQLELLVRLPPGRTEQRRQVAGQARALVKEGLADVRRAVRALRPAALEAFSLPEAVAALAADLQQSAHIHTVWQVAGEVVVLPTRLAIPLYRAAQEALTNVRRHAPAAQQVTVQLRYEPEAVVLSVENDGVPASPALRASLPPAGGTEGGPEGYGLRGLRERAELLGGTFSAGPDGTGSFRLEIHLPLP
jgi:signal transduction histidine kinase